ncbi:MAG TPA: hypothetical protein VMF90_05025 [Rhizobiaceae bacterium]|nr:hypothetical protein [Rhizobiaceae bacterium]
MDERLAELEHRSLQRILGDLWIMSGLGRRATILRSVHRLVTRLLRPAEAAARRLITVLAMHITVTLPPARTAAPNSSQPDTTGPDGVQSQADRPPADLPPDEWRSDGWRPFVLPELLPRLPDPDAQPRPCPIIFSGMDDEIDGSRLAHRIDALFHALDDIQAAAQRLARWQALRQRARSRGVFCAIQPLRPGPPLDLRGRAARRLKKHEELFGILESAHERAWWARNAPPDTS